MLWIFYMHTHAVRHYLLQHVSGMYSYHIICIYQWVSDLNGWNYSLFRMNTWKTNVGIKFITIPIRKSQIDLFRLDLRAEYPPSFEMCTTMALYVLQRILCIGIEITPPIATPIDSAMVSMPKPNSWCDCGNCLANCQNVCTNDSPPTTPTRKISANIAQILVEW